VQRRAFEAFEAFEGKRSKLWKSFGSALEALWKRFRRGFKELYKLWKCAMMWCGTRASDRVYRYLRSWSGSALRLTPARAFMCSLPSFRQ